MNVISTLAVPPGGICGRGIETIAFPQWPLGPQLLNDERPLADVLDREPVRHRFDRPGISPKSNSVVIDLDLGKGRLVSDLGRFPFLLFDFRLLPHSPLAILEIVGNLLELHLLNLPTPAPLPP